MYFCINRKINNMKKNYFLLALGLITLSTSVKAQCSDLFFSEYIEGSSSNKAVEIYNPTSSPVNLRDYVVYRNNNGSATPTDSLKFTSGTIAPGDVYIFANPSANAAILAEADTTHTLTFYNGDDAVYLVNTISGDTIDIIGVIGVDPGSGWTVGTGATNNNTLVRKIGVQQGQTDWAIGATEWDVFTIDMVDSLGAHTMTACNSTNIETINSNSFSVYPNPSNGMLNIVTIETLSNATITIRNITGQTVASYNFGALNATSIELNNVAGIYFVEVAAINFKKTVKVIKQ